MKIVYVALPEEYNLVYVIKTHTQIIINRNYVSNNTRINRNLKF
jgi:hypothetical protein